MQIGCFTLLAAAVFCDHGESPQSKAIPDRDLLLVWANLQQSMAGQNQITNSLSDSLHPSELLVACGRGYKSFEPLLTGE